MAKQSKIAEATGSASGGGAQNLGQRIEAAMADAILRAADDGIGADKPDQVREYMMAARQKVKDDYQAELAAQEEARRRAEAAAKKAYDEEMAKHNVEQRANRFDDRDD